MSYESWRISFQSSEQAARSAYEQASSLGDDLDDALKAKAQYQIMLADMTERLHSAEKQLDELLAALENAVSVAKTAHECWDNDQDMKVGKYLIALSGGLPGYDKRTDEIHAAIASVKGGAA